MKSLKLLELLKCFNTYSNHLSCFFNNYSGAKRPEEIPLNVFDDEDSLVVETACWAAGEKENPTQELINQLCFIADSHTDQLCREAAVAALGSIGSPMGLETVLEALKDKPAINIKTRRTHSPSFKLKIIKVKKYLLFFNIFI